MSNFLEKPWLKSFWPLAKQMTGPLTDELRLSEGALNLGILPHEQQAQSSIVSVCGYCSTGCGLRLHLRDGIAVGLTPDMAYPVNQGKACPKGWEALKALNSSERATRPLLRNRQGRQEPISWIEASSVFVQRIRALQEQHGPEALAFISTGQMTTEEMALLGAFAKFTLGVRHGDANTRQCMATAAVAYKQAFGFDAPPYTYADFEASDVIVLIGSNLCIAHPVMWQRIMRNPHKPKIIVVDPRQTETALAATQHVALQPKSDLHFFYGLAKLLIEMDALDHGFIEASTSGFAAYRQFLLGLDMAEILQKTGCSGEELQQLAQCLAQGKRVSYWWTMGVNQSHQGVKTAQAIINLALMTGQIGRAGTGANSITGQCNAMGSRLFSNTSSLFGGRDFGHAEQRQQVAQLLKIDSSSIPDSAGLAYDQIIDGIEQGQIKGLWVIGTNPAHSWIEQGRLQKLWKKLDFLVVQDMYASTETAALADLVLPAAGWGEKQGTFINSERRIGLINRVAVPPGEALPDFDIFRFLLTAWGAESTFQAWSSPEAVFKLLAELSKGRPCDFSGIKGYAELEREGGIQWPLPEALESLETERRLFSEGKFFHDNGKARFLYTEPAPPSEVTSRDFPMILLTGRGSSTQWHTETRTRQSAILNSMNLGEAIVEVAAADARRLGIEQGQSVLVSSPRGSVQVKAMVSQLIQPGQVFMPMHSGLTNFLTKSEFDPESRQPSYKHCTVRVQPQ